MAALPRGEGLSCLVLATIEGKRRGKKNRREPDSVGARGNATLDPTDRFAMKPRVAFVSHSDFGSYDTDSSRKMRHATALLKEKHPEIELAVAL